MSQPILVLINKRAKNVFSSYILEILDAEGIFTCEVKDVSQIDLKESPFDSYDLIILSNIELKEEVKEALKRYVQEGGNLIGLRPPLNLDFLFGMDAKFWGQKMIFNERYIKINKDHLLSQGIAADILQFHGEADVYYQEKETKVLAYLYNEFDVPTNNYPAIATFSYGKGHTAIFTYDLAKSTVLFHQGRYEQSSIGTNPNYDKDAMYKPNDLFVDYLDIRLKNIPQADIHQDILVKLINWLSTFKKPLPRIWYFPNGYSGVAFISGDSDGFNSADFKRTLSIIDKYKAKYTLYLMEKDYPVVSPNLEKRLRSKGYSFGQHIWKEPKPTLKTMQEEVKLELNHFQERYGYTPLSNRGHCCIWVGWTEMAKYLAENGIKIDGNFYCYRYIQYGYSNGSGLPMKFMDEKGKFIELYEQSTLFGDDCMLEDKTFLPYYTAKEAAKVTRRTIDGCVNKYHTVFHICFHPIRTRPGKISTFPWLNDLLSYCSQKDILFVSGDEWARFVENRRKIKIDKVQYSSNSGELQFSLITEENVSGITLMLPLKYKEKTLNSLWINKEKVKYTEKSLEGTNYALYALDIAKGEEVKVKVESN